MTLDFACGHRATLTTIGEVAPVCPECGERRIRHVVARAPRFRGCCTGPQAQTAALEPAVLAVAPDGPLRLKEP